MRSREPALSGVEGDPMPVDPQRQPDKESSEIPALGCSASSRTTPPKNFVIPTRERSETGGTCFLPGPETSRACPERSRRGPHACRSPAAARQGVL